MAQNPLLNLGTHYPEPTPSYPHSSPIYGFLQLRWAAHGLRKQCQLATGVQAVSISAALFVGWAVFLDLRQGQLLVGEIERRAWAVGEARGWRDRMDVLLDGSRWNSRQSAGEDRHVLLAGSTGHASIPAD